MPSRRQFLATVGAVAGAAGLAGCTEGGGEAPTYEGWLYDPGAALGRSFPWQAFLSADVPTAWRRRDRLPEEWVASATAFDQGVDSVDIGDLQRLTALGFGTADTATAGVTVALDGDIDPRPVAGEFARGPTVAEHDPVAGHRLFGYTPAFLERVRRNGVTAQGSLGLAVAEGRAVAGGLLSPDAHAVDTVATMARAGAGSRAEGESGPEEGVDGPDPDLRSVGRALSASPLGTPPVVSGIAFDERVAIDIAAAIPSQWPTLAATVDDLRAFGVGLRFADTGTLTEFVFAYDPRSIAENENLRAAARKLTDESEAPNSGIVGVRLGPDGRSLVVRTTVSPRSVWRDFRDQLPWLD